MRVHAPSEKMEMARGHFLALEADRLFAEDQHEDPQYVVRADQGSHQISS